MSSRVTKPQYRIHGESVGVLKAEGSRVLSEPAAGAFLQDVLETTFNSPGDICKPAPPLVWSTGIQQPILKTARLVLRPYTSDDARVFAKLAARRQIADSTIPLPHPRLEPEAGNWRGGNLEGRRQCQEVIFAIITKAGRKLIGAIGLRHIDSEHSHAAMGFWIGVDWWGRGYATEAAQALLRFGFEALQLNRIYAHHMLRNPASGRVLKRIGMQLEGVLREGVRKWGIFEDVAILSIIRREWMERGHLP